MALNLMRMFAQDDFYRAAAIMTQLTQGWTGMGRQAHECYIRDEAAAFPEIAEAIGLN
jgi:hypothetical protein